MKKFFMNPFAKMGVKGHNVCRMMALTLLAFTMGACSDEEEVAPIEFPAQQELTCNVGETANFTFKASADWQLTSSAVWCKFLVDDKEEFAVSGSAGEQNITIKAGVESHGHEMSVALITLNMGGKKEVVAKVSRSAQDYELKVYDLEGNELDSIEVGYSKFSKFKVKANFRFAATNHPSWVELDGDAMVGSENVETEGGLRIVSNGIVEKYPVTADQGQRIEFADEDGKASFSFPLTFAGMDSTEIEITGVTNNVWDWTVSLDGKEFLQESASGLTGESSKTLYKNRLPFTIKALNDDYEMVYVQKIEMMQGMYNYAFNESEGVDWMSFDKATMTLSVEKSFEEREGFVFAFPAAVYNEIKDDLWANMVENVMDPETGMSTQELKYEYLENNLLINFVQKEKKEEIAPSDEPNVVVTYMDSNWMTVEAELTKATDEGIIQDLGTENIYYVDKNLTQSFFIDPKLEGEWDFMIFYGDEDVTSIGERMEGQLNVWTGDMTIADGNELQVIFKQNWMNERVVIIK